MVIAILQRPMMPVIVVLQLVGCASTEPRHGVVLGFSDDGRNLEVSYRLAEPATAIVFARNPDDSRSVHWRTTSTDFEIVRRSGKELIRRKDGGYFSTAGITVPAAYRPLPKDYAAFSPFSDGGMLVHSGRFQGCPVAAGLDDRACEGPWPMQIAARPGTHIFLNGTRYEGSASWLDTRDGSKIYVGPADLVADARFIQVVDPELPAEISGPMFTSMPQIMRYFERRLPPLVQRPMLFVSYDPDYEHGYGHQGGTLPDQVFMHFYGPVWRDAGAKGGMPEDTLWFFAHEVAHLFQHGVKGTRESSWIHEGSAEAFAYLALESLGLVPAEYLHERRRRAVEACREALGKGPLTGAADRGEFSDYYDCGLILFLAIDNTLRASSGKQQGLSGFWSALIAGSASDEPWTSAEFLSHAATWVGEDLAQTLLTLATEKHDNPVELLTSLELQ